MTLWRCMQGPGDIHASIQAVEEQMREYQAAPAANTSGLEQNSSAAVFMPLPIAEEDSAADIADPLPCLCLSGLAILGGFHWGIRAGSTCRASTLSCMEPVMYAGLIRQRFPFVRFSESARTGACLACRWSVPSLSTRCSKIPSACSSASRIVLAVNVY
jgi:hypothetical protein